MAEAPAEPEASTQERATRRLLSVAVLAAAAASGVALTLALVWQRTAVAPSGPPPLLLPKSFHQPGFLGGIVHYVGGGTVPADARSGGVSADVRRGTVAIVVACFGGTATLRIGAADASARCTGRPTGVVVIKAPGGRLDVRGTISVKQPRPCTIGIYQ
jgi:hypothetical protein